MHVLDGPSRSHLLQRYERLYANERRQPYCVRNINGVITVTRPPPPRIPSFLEDGEQRR